MKKFVKEVIAKTDKFIDDLLAASESIQVLVFFAVLIIIVCSLAVIVL